MNELQELEPLPQGLSNNDFLDDSNVLLDNGAAVGTNNVQERKINHEGNFKEPEKVPEEMMSQLVVKSKKFAECDNGGIVLSSVDTNLQAQKYSYPILYIGTPYWDPYICNIDNSKYTTFEVKNIEKIQNSILDTVLFDDYLMVKINDHVVYHGPDSEAGEDRIELVRSGKHGLITTNGKNRKSCERYTNWHKHPNTDLKPYLREGSNTLSFTIATAGCGRAEAWLSVKQSCCYVWEEHWLHSPSVEFCAILDKQCIASPEVRYVDGFRVFKECWQYKLIIEVLNQDNN